MDVLTSWDSWCRDDILPYIGHAAEKFGASRIMAASNWPIVLIRTSYQQAWGELRAAIEGVFPGHHDRQFVLGGTAQRWYGLPPPGQTTT
jgi:L-fuconolactonase